MEGGRPRRVLTLLDSTSLIVGIIVGAGVFVTAPQVARGVGSGWSLLALWGVGGALSLCGVLGYAELATAYPEQGGDYVYLTRAYGRWAGFLFGWLQTLVVRPGDIAVMAYVFATAAEPVVGRGWGGRPVLAATVVVVLSAINMVGVRLGIRTQNVLTGVKLVGVALVAAVAVVARGAEAADRVPAPTTEPLPLAVALILVLFSYGGWNEIAYISAEVKRPDRNVLRAMLVGMAVVTGIYLALNTAFLRALGHGGLAASDAAATETVASVLPGVAGIFVAALICACALGAVNGLIVAGARIAYALGRDHRLFAPVGRWSDRSGTPVAALALQAALAVGLILLLGSFVDTVMYTAAPVYLFYLATSIAVIVLRVRDRSTPRAYRATGFPVTTVVFCLVCAFLIVSSVTYRPTMAAASLLVILLGVPAYLWSGDRPPGTPSDRALWCSSFGGGRSGPRHEASMQGGSSAPSAPI